MTGFEALALGTAASGGVAATGGLFGTAGAFSLGSTLGTFGTAASVLGQISAGNNAQMAANYNAQLAYQQAAAQRAAAAENAKREKRLGLKRQGTLRSLDPDKLDLLEDSAIEEELEVQSILHAGEVGAIGSQNTASLERARGKAARTSALFGAAGTALLGGAKVAGLPAGPIGGQGLTTGAGGYTDGGRFSGG